MKTIENKHQFIFRSKDQYGIFELRIHKDCSQIQLETQIEGDFGGDSVFADVSIKELIAINDMIKRILDKKQFR